MIRKWLQKVIQNLHILENSTSGLYLLNNVYNRFV